MLLEEKHTKAAGMVNGEEKEILRLNAFYYVTSTTYIYEAWFLHRFMYSKQMLQISRTKIHVHNMNGMNTKYNGKMFVYVRVVDKPHPCEADKRERETVDL